jgi:hypothetical protein
MPGIYEEVIPGVSISVDTSGIIRPATVAGRAPLVIGTACKGEANKLILIESVDQLYSIFGAPDPYDDNTGIPLTLVRFAEFILANSVVWCIRTVETTAKKMTGNFDYSAPPTTYMAVRAKEYGAFFNYMKYRLTKTVSGSGFEVKLELLYPNHFRFNINLTDTIEMNNSNDPLNIHYVTWYSEFATGVDPTELYKAMTDTFTAGGTEYIIESQGWFDGLLKFSDFFEIVQHGAAAAEYIEEQLSWSDFDFITTGAQLGTNWSTDDSVAVDAAVVGQNLELSLLEEIYYVMVAGADENSTYFAKMLAHITTALGQSKERIMLVGSSNDYSDLSDFMDSSSGFLTDTTLLALKGNERVMVMAGGIEYPNPYNPDDPTGNPTEFDILPGSYAVALIAGCLLSRDWHEGITNMAPSQAGYVFEDTQYRFQYGQVGKLTQGGVNLIEYKGAAASLPYVIVDGITFTDATSPFHDINIRQIIDYIRKGMRGSSLPFIGKLNNARTRGTLRTSLERFLDRALARGFLNAYVDLQVTATRADEIAGIAYVDVSVQPVYILKFIKIRIKVE